MVLVPGLPFFLIKKAQYHIAPPIGNAITTCLIEGFAGAQTSACVLVAYTSKEPSYLGRLRAKDYSMRGDR